MADIYVFGAGINAEHIISMLDYRVTVKGILDNNPNCWGKKLQGILTYPVSILEEQEFNYIVVSVKKDFAKIKEQLNNYNVHSEKVLIPFSADEADYLSWKDVFDVEKFVCWKKDLEIEKLMIQLGNMKYELVDELRKEEIVYPIIKGGEETIHEIVMQGKSISRYGDGEFDLLLGMDNSFQKKNEKLAIRLAEILKSNLENHIVAIPNVYGAFENRTEEFKECFRRHLSGGRREKEYALLDMKKVYYDAFISRPYKDYEDKSHAGEHFQMLKQIWNGKDVTIVEGMKTRMGVGNDLLAGVKSCNRILCPVVNAFDFYEDILTAIKKVDRSRIILIALGATATVLAYDLAQEGYQAIDIGHIDIEYEWYLRGALKAEVIEGKYVNEASGGRIVSDDIVDSRYLNEVMITIGG